jgi:hypothetical protein
MENKYVGYVLLGVSILVLINIFVFNSMLGSFSVDTCTPEGCLYHNSFNSLIYLSYGIVGLLFMVGLILIFSKPQKEIVVKKIKERIKKKKIDTSDLKPEEKQVFNLVKENKAIFQSDLIEKTGFGKAKMTRIIDRLEGKDFVERKRRGMTNVVVMKD